MAPQRVTAKELTARVAELAGLLSTGQVISRLTDARVRVGDRGVLWVVIAAGVAYLYADGPRDGYLEQAPRRWEFPPRNRTLQHQVVAEAVQSLPFPLP